MLIFLLDNLVIEKDLNTEEAFICFDISFLLSALLGFFKKKEIKIKLEIIIGSSSCQIQI